MLKNKGYKMTKEKWMEQLENKKFKDKVKEGKFLKNRRRGTLKEYKQYLQSDEWKQLRLKKIRQVESRCQVCYSPDHLEAHHRTYKNFKEENLNDIVVLCRDCHSLFHKNRKLSRD